ncbi:MAG: signal recognition particle protein [Myxococcales bacterium]|nr:signal recognition particle protein [Myxococcales bacterium]
MFDVLSRGFKNATLALQGKARLSEESLSPALREVRTSLLQADVELGVVKAFLASVKEKSLGEIVPLKVAGQTMKLTPQDWFVKACYDELCELMGPVDTSLDLDGKPAVILMVGLQGSGKTTTSGKIAKMLAGEGKKPLLVAADIYRPAAVDQLQTLGRKIGVPVFHQADTNPVELARLAVIQARNTGRDVVIVDTAGRLTVDEAMMQEVADIKATVQPKNVLFVVDAMIGQDAVKTAAEFNRRLEITGFILTKLDGDARGGAALSIKEVTGKPIKYLAHGEGMDKIEEFRPEGLASRILGMGDIVGLVQDFEKHIDEEQAEKDATKMLQGQFNFDDFLNQMRTIRKMGSLKDLFERMPFFSDMMPKGFQLDDSELDRIEAMINSMTKAERKYPDILNPSRMRRIAKGSGNPMTEVEGLVERFGMARSMMADLGRNTGLLSMLGGRGGGMGGGGFF